MGDSGLSGTSRALRHLAPVGAERRAYPRRPVSEPCIVTIFSGTAFVRAKGTVQDVSTFGLRVKTTLRAAAGSRIKILMDRGMVIGDVRHCTAGADHTFELGVSIDPRYGFARLSELPTLRG